MTVNQEMFQRIDAILTEFPELHLQRFWQEDDTDLNNSCGTTRCVAGWAVWLRALDLGLVSRKRDFVDQITLHRVAEREGIATKDEDGFWRDAGSLYQAVGARVLGLSDDDAHSLFMDMLNSRVTVRVASYATTGEDISDEEFEELADA